MENMEQETRIIETTEDAPIDYSSTALKSARTPGKNSDQQEVWEWIRKAADVCEQASKGNLEARVLGCTRTDELGRLMRRINDMLDITDAFVR